MLNKTSERVLSLLLIIICLFFYYSKFILSPNTYLSGLSGDGIMINYTYAGHIKNDSTYTNFQGMNYPYGQTHIYTGGHPVFANAVKFLSHFSPWFVSHSIGIINILIVLSYVGCTFFLCLILQRLRLPSALVIFGSVGITLLSPQIFRWGGHPELSYAGFFPLTWWLLIRFMESEKIFRWSLLIICNSIFWFFVCPYYVMLASIFYALCYLLIFVQKKNISFFTRKKIAFAFINLVLPLVITRLYLFAADVHKFRSEHPYGFNVYFAQLNTVFAPLGKPFDSLFQLFFNLDDRHWEGWAYIGLPSVLMALYSIFRLIRYAFRKKWVSILNPVVPSLLRWAAWASVLVLIFSMCMPFRLAPNLFFGHLGFIEQFRSLGRFAWIFYYVFTVYSLYISYLLFRRTSMKHKKYFGYAWCTFFILCFYVESYSYHKNNSEFVYGSKNYFNEKLLPEDYAEIINKINQVKSEYQCLVPLPFYNVGSENFGQEYSDETITKSMVVSYWTNLPLLANSDARTPIIEAKYIMQFFSPPLTNKEIEKALPNKKPFLILYDKEKLSLDEKFWLDKSDKIFENNSFVLGHLAFEKVFTNDLNEEIKKFQSISDGLIKYNGLYITSLPDTIIYINFDSLSSPEIFRGKGALKGVKKNYTTLIPNQKCFLKADRDYVLGFWYYNKGELRNQISCILEEKEEGGKNSSWTILIDPKFAMKIDGDWSYLEKLFRVKASTKEIKIFMKGDDYSRQEFYLDDLILRPADVNVYFTSETSSANSKEELRKSFFMQSNTGNSQEEKERRISEISNNIRNTPEWLKSVEEKAIVKNISLDSMIQLDAAFVYEEELKKQK